MLEFLRARIKADKNQSVLYPDFKGGEYDFGVEVKTYSKIRELTANPPFTLRIPMRSAETRLEAFNWTCSHALELASKRDDLELIVAIDEAQRVTNKNVNAEGFELLQENGGMYGVDIIFTTHRPGDVHGSLVAACDRVIVFQTHHSRDIDKFQEYIDVPDEAFKSLERGDYLEWHTDHGYRFVRNGVTSKWQSLSENEST